MKRKLDNLGLEIPVYKPGDLVKLEVPRVKPGDSKKLKFLWSGPWKVVRQGNNPHVYYLEDDTGTELPAPVSVTRIMLWNHSHDYSILEKDVAPPKLVSIDFTGDKTDDRDLSTEDSVSYDEGSNPAKKSSSRAFRIGSVKVSPTLPTSLEMIDNSKTRSHLAIDHEAKLNSEGHGVLKQRLLPQSVVRIRKPPKKLDL